MVHGLAQCAVRRGPHVGVPFFTLQTLEAQAASHDGLPHKATTKPSAESFVEGIPSNTPLLKRSTKIPPECTLHCQGWLSSRKNNSATTP